MTEGWKKGKTQYFGSVKNINDTYDHLFRTPYENIEQILLDARKNEGEEASSFQLAIDRLAKDIYENAKAHGFYDGEVDVPLKLALIHSEVTEALEAFREGDVGLRYAGTMGKYLKPEGFGSELADIVIRTIDLAHAVGIDSIGHIIQVKHEFNKTRSYKHGKKF